MTDYDQTIEAFIAPLAGAGRAATVVACYHEVRNFDYVSDGVRDPQTVIDRRAGSCSGKHIVLRDCLTALGEKASIETVEGDFAGGIPDHETMPGVLRSYAQEGGVRDFHQFVVWDSENGACRLDATWPDRLEMFGFSVNRDWQGHGDTELALEPDRFCGPTNDIQHTKAKLIAGLAPAERERREAFLQVLSHWLGSLR